MFPATTGAASSFAVTNATMNVAAAQGDRTVFTNAVFEMHCARERLKLQQTLIAQQQLAQAVAEIKFSNAAVAAAAAAAVASTSSVVSNNIPVESIFTDTPASNIAPFSGIKRQRNSENAVASQPQKASSKLLSKLYNASYMTDDQTRTVVNKLAKHEMHKFSVNGKVVLRHKRVPLSTHQKEALEAAFVSGRVPRGRHGRAIKEHLGENIGLTLTAVNKWFDNRRVKDALQNRRLIDMVDGGHTAPKVDASVSYDSDQHQPAAKKCITYAGGNVQVPIAKSKPLSRPSSPPNIAKAVETASALNITSAMPVTGTSTPLNWTKSLSPSVCSAFRLIRLYFNGHIHLYGVLEDDPNSSAPSSKASSKPIKGKKRKLMPTLRNVVDHMMRPGNVLYPLVCAIRLIAANGATKALIAKVELEDSNFRTFLMWFALGKYSGDKTCEKMYRAIQVSIGKAFEDINVSDELRIFFPALLADSAKTVPFMSPASDVQCSPSSAKGDDLAIFAVDVPNPKSHWAESFLNNLVKGKKLVRPSDGRIGHIEQVLPPKGEICIPRIKVHFESSDPQEVCEVAVYSWEDIKDSIQ